MRMCTDQSDVVHTAIAASAVQGETAAMRLPPMPSVADLVRLYGLSARSQLSQNFLLDGNIADKFVRAARCIAGGHVLEVGPGPGSLTRSILRAGAARVVAVEKDARFLPSLELLAEASGGVLTVVRGDILTFDYRALALPSVAWDQEPRLAVIGNLPFNIATPLLIRWLSMMATREGPFAHGRAELVLSFQKEVAERIVAQPNTAGRTRISAITQLYCDATLEYRLPGRVFVPPPKVDAAVVRLVPRATIPPIATDFKLAEAAVRWLFSAPRKTMTNVARRLVGKDEAQTAAVLSRAGVDGMARAESLDNAAVLRAIEAYSLHRPLEPSQ